ncbi:alpha/beta hydrolase [Shewanella sp. 202IG2-18]|uniref:alpha/beta hydrolase n=1 Tax=Parashewanella hymeniacidonis TaxID=2807618 RepID=UPI00196090C2|nr:alpha/beta hydrolase-fold protein [Parashewanella hymeniacidonis]MBM7070808.1 alpha/beta hydrolase [Parashewanella hymeniacidonis]
MKRLLLILTLLINLNANAIVIDKTPLVIGESISFKSKALNETRQFNVYLPVSYFKAQSKQYPVIYLLDGGVDEDLVHMSGLTQFLSFSWINSMPEVIVVGIQNVDRRRDFTYPSSDLTDQKELPTSGKSDDFISHLSNELLPLIDAHYRTTNNRTLVGQSLGGLLASTILHQQPNMFTNYLIVSPSLWWDKESLLSRPLDLNTFKGKVFITVGEEGEIMKRVAKSLYKKTLQAGLKSNMVGFEFYPTLDHGDVLHLGAYKGLGFLFNKPETR